MPHCPGTPYLVSMVLHERLHVALLPAPQLGSGVLGSLLRAACLLCFLLRRLQPLLQLAHLALLQAVADSTKVGLLTGDRPSKAGEAAPVAEA